MLLISEIKCPSCVCLMSLCQFYYLASNFSLALNMVYLLINALTLLMDNVLMWMILKICCIEKNMFLVIVRICEDPFSQTGLVISIAISQGMRAGPGCP